MRSTLCFWLILPRPAQKIPHFGGAELVSFACDCCGYKYNSVRTAVGQAPGSKGRTLRLVVPAAVRGQRQRDENLNRQVTGLPPWLHSSGRYLACHRDACSTRALHEPPPCPPR